MSWEESPAPTKSEESVNPASDKIVGILATLVYGICCVMQGVGSAFGAAASGGQTAPEVTITQYALLVISLAVALAALGSGIMVIMSKARGFLLGVVAMIASIAINVYSMTQIPMQMKLAVDQAAKQSTNGGQPMPENMAGIMTTAAYATGAVVILINVLYLAYCGSRWSQTKGG
jgi:hypothetical protein